MSQNNKLTIIGVVVALIMGLLWYFHKTSYNWTTELYNNDYGQPYGLKFLDGYLKTQFEGDNFMYADSTLDIELGKLDKSIRSNYLFVGGHDYLRTNEVNALMDFVEEGNNAIYIAKDFPQALFKILHKGDCKNQWTRNEFIQEKSVNVKLLNKAYSSATPIKYARINQDKEVIYHWNYIPAVVFCESSENFEKLGALNNKMNFFRVKFGEGYFYFNSNPELFTNYYLSQDRPQKYVEEVFSYATGNRMIWDKQLRQEGSNGNSRSRSNNKSAREDGPLSFILSITSLKWAFYVLAASLFVYFIFYTKRKQRIIPIMSAKENSAIEYVETISELYFQRKGNDKIFTYIESQWYEFVRKRYRISTKKIDADFVKTSTILL